MATDFLRMERNRMSKHLVYEYLKHNNAEEIDRLQVYTLFSHLTVAEIEAGIAAYVQSLEAEKEAKTS
jgi:hypothetical protein